MTSQHGPARRGLGSLAGVQVRSIMSTSVLGIAPEAPLDVALQLMVQAKVRHLPVVVDGHCVGLLHESDALWDLWARRDARRDAGDCCRRPPPAVDAGSGIAEAASVIVQDGTDSAVVTENSAVVGIVTAVDIVRLIAHGTGT